MDEKDFILKGHRKYYAFFCVVCKEKVYRRPDIQKKYKNAFCSHACRAEFQTTSVDLECEECGKPVTKLLSQFKKNAHHYCSHSCAASSTNRRTRRGKKHPNYTDGSSSYRDRAFRNFEQKCSNPDCLITHTFGDETVPMEMLDVDHIDGDRSNNKLKNLQILCVWCHALKTREIEIIFE